MNKTLTIIVRVVTVVLGIVVLAIAGVVGLIAVNSVTAPTADAYANTSFTARDGTEVAAYLAEPPGDGPHPAVLMVHEWWGLNAEITEMAEILAEEGYVVLAPDTYRGDSTGIVPRALFLRITVDTERVDQDMMAAYEWLSARNNVDAERIGVMGFCYGGGVALRHGIQNPDVVAVANLYGDTVSDPDAFGALLQGDTPVLGVFGDEDMNIPVEEARAFEAALDAAGIPHEVNIYAEMPHAFIQPHNIDEPGTPAEAWDDVVGFLAEHLQPGAVE